MTRFLQFLTVAALLMFPFEWATAKPLDPGPAKVIVACRDMQGVEDMVAWAEAGTSMPTEHMERTCTYPGMLPNPIGLDDALKRFGDMTVVVCSADSDGDKLIVFFSDTPKRFKYSLWYRVPNHDEVCAQGLLKASARGDTDFFEPPGQEV